MRYLVNYLIFISIFIFCHLKKKNLILGAIKNYSWEIIQPFFTSLYKANFQNYDCIIFTFNISNITTDKLKSFGVIIYELPEKYNGMKINNVRYKLYEEFLRDKLNKYDLVFHADIRDTFFQKDIFKIYKNKKSFIGFALEDGNNTHPMNADWMKHQYGEEVYEKLKDEKIICSGTIWGTVDKFYEFVRNIWEEIQLKSPYDYSVHDQTATNYLIYYKKMFKNCIIISDINNGPVMTVGLAQYKNFSYDLDDNLLNFKAKNVAYVIHQYDRVPKIVEIVKRKFTSCINFKMNSPIIHNKAFKKEIQINSSNKKKNHNFYFIIMILGLIISVIIKKNKAYP